MQYNTTGIWDSRVTVRSNLTEEQYDALCEWCIGGVSISIPLGKFNNPTTKLPIIKAEFFIDDNNRCAFNLTKKSGLYLRYHVHMHLTSHQWVDYMQPIFKYCWDKLKEEEYEWMG